MIRHRVPTELLHALERQLHLLIRGRSAELVISGQIRLPQLAPITELIKPKLWFPVPGQNGGFSIDLLGEDLKVASWNESFKDWTQIHRITGHSIQLMAEGGELL